MKKLALTLPLTLTLTLTHLGTAAWAHDGHGLGGTHWHATDTLGFVGVVALVALGWWLGRK